MVIAIVAVLAALLFPAYGRVMQGAANAGCVSNLRQIGMASNLFASDHNQFYPSAWDSSLGIDYDQYLQPYLSQAFSNQKNLWICPGAVYQTNLEGLRYMGTYSLHNRLSNYLGSVTSIPRSRVPRPTQVILIGDGSQCYASRRSEVAFWNPGDMTNTSAPLTSKPTAGTGPDVDTWAGQGWLRYRHNGGVNVVMVDGHITNIKKGALTLANIVPDR